MGTLRLHKIIFSFLSLACSFECFAQVKPLARAFAHNDYKHVHPLYDAVDNGFTGFEADVFLRKNQLIIAHISPFLKTKMLEGLYLEPLDELIKKNGGHLYSAYSQPVILLIDIKSDPIKTYDAIKTVLEKYSSLLTYEEGGIIHEAAVTVILSGHKPFEPVKKEIYRNIFIDENLLNIGTDNFDKNYAPLASTKYSNLLRWRGKGEIPADQKDKLIHFVKEAHAQGKKVRLWASPENKNVWKALHDAGIDLINTDKLEELKDFLVNENR